uniref:Uncharacterized protein n=1 Tax=viral metagenome TaxID=1070528 RepID=A0A6M3IZC5_9ZZZZ
MDDKQFWEYFGWRIVEDIGLWYSVDPITNKRYMGTATKDVADKGLLYLPLDLNNLFKYCVPKLFPKTFMMETCDDGYEFAILSDKPSGGVWCHWDKDPAQALRKAIEKAIA